MLNTTQCNLGYNCFAVSVHIYDKGEKLLTLFLCGLLEAHMPTVRQDESYT